MLEMKATIIFRTSLWMLCNAAIKSHQKKLTGLSPSSRERQLAHHPFGREWIQLATSTDLPDSGGADTRISGTR